MSTKDWKNKEISTLLSEAWGFKFNSLQEFDEFEGAGEIQEEAEVSEDAEVQEEAVEEPADAKGQKELEEGAEEASAETLEEEEIEEAVDTESIEPQEDVVGDVEISEDTLSEAVQDLLEKNNGRYSEEQVRTALKQAITIIKERRKMGRKSKN